MNIEICICTYKRPRLFYECLESIAKAINNFKYDYDVSLLVIDNDCKKSAEDAVGKFSKKYDLLISYFVEAEQSISNVRNRALVQCNSRLLCFVDDDETCSKNWLNELVKVYLKTKGQVIIGPVIPIFSEDTKRHFINSNFFMRTRYEDCVNITKGGIGNALLDIDFIKKNKIKFDSGYGLSGGEDSKFFMDIMSCGGLIYWANNAEVFEIVAENRKSFIYIAKRSLRGGHTHCKLRVVPGGIFKISINLFVRLAEIFLYFLLFPFLFIFNKTLLVKIWARFFASFGQIYALFSNDFKMYK